jgi:ADP-heptose:LPS heptosyltransferase
MVNEKETAPQKLILENYQSPGDIVMLTAAVRDLHLLYPGRYLTDVRTSSPGLWEQNPFITPLDESDPDVRCIPMNYPLIHQSNTLPYHFIHGFIQYLNFQLGTAIYPTAFKGDIHLSEQEMSWISQVQEITGNDKPFWIIVSGGKYDFTCKWWDASRCQQVVDHFLGKIQFVQVGELVHNHPPLNNVIDLRGKTDMRQLVRLVYHSAGIVCPVTLLMHLAAAVPMNNGSPRLRPCVVIAGGREPVQWEAYPGHQFLHTIGALPCCATGGCWRSRVLPLGDGDEKDAPDQLCMHPVGFLPKCMDMISVEEVVQKIHLYLDNSH